MRQNDAPSSLTAPRLAGFRLGYRPSLDGLRGIAVLVVMAHHAYVPFFRGGGVGVDIFFVLSGFLITSLLAEEWSSTNNIRLGAFYLRRAFRLLPALFGLLAVLQIFMLIRMRGEAFWEMEKATLAVIGYVGNWVRAFGILDLRALSHTWSLSIEEQFYMLWPICLLVALKRGKTLRWVWTALLIVIGLIVLSRAALAGILSADRIYNGSDMRFDELLTGCALALSLQAGAIGERARSAATWLVCPAIAVIVSLIAFPVSITSLARWGWPALEASVMVIILYVVTRSSAALHRVLEVSWLVWVGRISYGLYLWHVPILGKTGGLPLPRPVAGAVGIALTFATASLSYYGMERRFLRRKAKLHTPEPMQAAAQAA